MVNIKKIAYTQWVVPILVFNLLLAGLVVLSRRCLPPQVPLFYGKPAGEEQLAESIFLVTPPLVATLFTLLNTVIINLTKDEFVQKTLIAITIFVSLLSAITVVKVILLVNSC